MATEKGLKRIIFLYAGKIKRLRGEIEDTIARKKDAEADLRDIKWDMKLSKKAVKKETIPPRGPCMPDDLTIEFLGKKKATKKKVVKKLYRPNPLMK